MMHFPYSEASFAQVVVEATARRRRGVATAVEDDAATIAVGCIGREMEEVAYVNNCFISKMRSERRDGADADADLRPSKTRESLEHQRGSHLVQLRLALATPFFLEAPEVTNPRLNHSRNFR
jgi:hypothetical protein